MRARCSVMFSLGILIGACAHPAHQRVPELSARADECDSFPAYDAELRALQDEVLATAPGEALVSASAKLAEARRRCARHVLTELPRLRQSRGLEATQAELDAMALAFPERALRGMVDEVFGVEAVSIRPMLALALATAEASRRARHDGEREALAAWQPAAPENAAAQIDPKLDVDAQLAACTAREPTRALDCLAELSRRGLPEDAVRAAADQVVSRALAERPEGADAQARMLASLLDHLEGLPPTRAAKLTLVALDWLRRKEWPRIEAALTAGHVEQAAVLAEPYLRVPQATRVLEIRELAVARQLELIRAAAGRSMAAALHRQLAIRFGLTPTPWLALESHWDTARWQCAHPLPALPGAPAGVQLRLVARCSREKPRPVEEQNDKTFELEKQLTAERVDGDVLATCAGKLLTYHLAVRDLAVDGPWTAESPMGSAEAGMAGGPGHALRLELETLVKRIASDCRAARTKQQDQDCAGLSNTTDPLDVEQRFTEHALALGEWPACFSTWFTARYGVPVPSLH